MPNTPEETRIPLVSEEASVSTASRVKGVTRVQVHTEKAEEMVATRLLREEAEVKHVPIGRLLEEGEPEPEVRQENGVLVLPVFEEVAVVVKRIRLVEEIHVTLRQQTEERVTPVILRKQHATVERISADAGYEQTPDTDEDTGEVT